MGRFIVSRRVNGEYQFNLKAENGENILTSEGYITKANCLQAIQSVKLTAPNENRFDKRISSNGKYYFNLKAVNGQIIGTSNLYESLAGRENGVFSVQRNSLNADIEDQS